MKSLEPPFSQRLGNPAERDKEDDRLDPVWSMAVCICEWLPTTSNQHHQQNKSENDRLGDQSASAAFPGGQRHSDSLHKVD